MQKIDPELLKRYSRGECTAEEIKRVQDWLDSPQSLPAAETGLSEQQRIDTQAKLMEGILNGMTGQPKRTKRMGLLPWAAAAVLLMGIGSWWIMDRNASLDNRMVSISNEDAGIDTLHMADGTTIYLNEGATVEYSASFGRTNRHIELKKGEAFFDVAHDAMNKFVVHVAENKVTVLGTKFNVKHATDALTVTLMEGKIAFDRKNHKTYTLIPGEQIVYHYSDHHLIKSAPLLLENYVAWKEGVLRFEDTPMDQVLATLGQHYGLNFGNNRTTGLGKMLFTGKFKHESIDEVLRVLQESSGLKFEKKGNRITVFLK